MSQKYEESGVSLNRGYKTVNQIKKHINFTKNMGVMGNIGNFGGLFDLSKYQVKNPVLVSGTDGVGTKLLLAQEAHKHDTIGIDLVAMCVNDIITLGAKPLFFLDYIATGKVFPDVVEQIVKGIADGCKQSDCALIGGETAEMPDMYQENHYDLAGYTTGVVEKENIINSENVKVGDILIGLPSSGLHSNGYSLVRKILFKDHNYALTDYIEELECTLEEELLKPTKIYVEPVLDVVNQVKIHSIAHITGGGFYENIPRAIPTNLGIRIDKDSIPHQPIFGFLQKLGEIEDDEMYHIYNMGIGMVLVLQPQDVEKVIDILNTHNVKGSVIGEVVSSIGVVIQ